MSAPRGATGRLTAIKELRAAGLYPDIYRLSAGEAGGRGGRWPPLRDRCPHRFVPLSMGQRTCKGVTCGYHGLIFDPTGACVDNPHGPITQALKVAAYPIVERYQQIWLWMGDPALADPRQIPDFSFLDDAALRPLWGYMWTNANYELMTDNIMDLGHIMISSLRHHRPRRDQLIR